MKFQQVINSELNLMYFTRVNSDSTYYAYEKNRDQWGFSNSRGDMWPTAWWQQFVYNGVDPFTSRNYSQWVADSAFKSTTSSSKFPDWVSWVNTFSVNACYFSTFFGIYRSAAVIAWKSKLETGMALVLELLVQMH